MRKGKSRKPVQEKQDTVKHGFNPYILLFILLLAVCSSVILFQIEGDPYHALSWSAGPFSDEAFWAASAINRYNHSSWLVDGNWPRDYMTPLISWLQYLSLNVFGVSLFSVRIISSICAIALLILFFVLIRREYSDKEALFACALLSLNIPFLAYAKLALLEVPMYFFLILGFFLVYNKNKYIISLAGAIMLFAALGIKIAGLSVVFITILALLWDYIKPEEDKEVAKERLKYFALGCIAFALLWGLGFILPNYKAWISTYHNLSSAQPLVKTFTEYMKGLGRLGTLSFLSQQAPAQLITAYACWIVVSFFAISSYGERISLSVKWSLLMLLLLPFYLALNTYAPLRYETILLLPLPVLFVEGTRRLKQLVDGMEIQLQLPRLIIFTIIAYCGFYLILRFFGSAIEFIPYRYAIMTHNPPESLKFIYGFAWQAILVIILALPLSYMIYKGGFRLKKIHFIISEIIFILLFCFSLLLAISHFYANYKDQAYTMRFASKEIAGIIRDKRIGGVWAGLPAFSGCRYFSLYEGGLNKLEDAKDIDFLLIDPANEEGKRLLIKDNVLSLLEISQFMVGKKQLVLLRNMGIRSSLITPLEKACTAYEKEDFKTVKDSLEVYLKYYPDILSVKLLLAKSYFMNGDYNSSMRIVRDLISKRPNWAAPYSLLAMNFYLLKDYGSAKDYLKKALDLNFFLADPKVYRQIMTLEQMMKKDLSK